MGKNPVPGAAFYKFLTDLGDSTSQLIRLIPPDFVKNHGDSLSENVKLSTGSGDFSWIVKIEQIGQKHFFTDGWMKFAQDADLKSMDFVLFTLVERSKFEVSIYDVSGCTKELRSCPGTREQAADHHHKNCDEVRRSRGLKKKVESCEYEDAVEHKAGSGGRCWRFVKKVTKYHETELDIPVDFVLDTGIATNRKVKLQGYSKWKKWPVYVTLKRSGKFAFSAGWNEFLNGTKVVIGSTMSFTFAPASGNIIEAKVLKKGRNAELFRSAKRRRGRPPKFCGC